MASRAAISASTMTSPTLILNGMRGAAFIGRKSSQLCSRPQRRNRQFLIALVDKNTRRKKTPPMHTIEAALH